MTNRLLHGNFPGGLQAAVVGGMSGAFLGGVVFIAAADGDIARVDALSLVTAFAGAVVLLRLMRWADQAEPRTR
jgi:uncharacterized membrane protein YeaQ/YmgE (transglycosylase-associated protein family)